MCSLCSPIRCISTSSLFFFHLSISATKADSGSQLLFFNYPVVHKVKIVAFSHKQISQHGYQLLIVRFLFKLKLSAVVQHLTKLFRMSLSQIFNTCHCLLNLDLLIFLLLRFSRETLPWKVPSDKVH